VGTGKIGSLQKGGIPVQRALTPEEPEKLASEIPVDDKHGAHDVQISRNSFVFINIIYIWTGAICRGGL
jgi:hypothetical protein